MNKRRMLLVLVLLLCMWLTGCEKQTKEPENTSGELAQSDSDLFYVEEETEEKVEVPEGLQGLCESLEKKDATAQAQYNVMNRMYSADLEKNQKSWFCIDKDTGVSYFVNQNEDWYIYRLKDGKAELAVALPAKELSVWEGTVYFMVDSHGKYTLEEMSVGDIFAYRPEDGSVTKIYAAGTTLKDGINQRMTVNEKGIFFSAKMVEKVEFDGREIQLINEKFYCLPFDAEEPVEDIYQTTNAGWGDYFLGLSLIQDMDTMNMGLVLLNRADNAVESKINLNVGSSSMGCIMGDVYYGISGYSVVTKNLLTDEMKQYDFQEALENAGKVLGAEYKEETMTLSVVCFTMVKEEIWIVVGGSSLVRINLQTDEKTVFNIAHGIENCRLGALYTDGENLYGMYAENYQGKQHMVQILTDNVVGISEDSGLPLLEVKDLVTN